MVVKKGLVLEGGAMRGMFTAGVLDVLMEQNVQVDGVIGVSAGAVFGCNYISKQIGRTIRYNMKYSGDKRYCSIRSLIRTGDLYGAEFCYHKLPTELDVFDVETFKNSSTEFYVVCTDVVTGEIVYHKCTDAGYKDLEYMRASASMPLASRVVEMDGKKMLDGGIADSIPLKYFESIGYNKNLVILTQPADFVKEKNKAIPLFKLFMRKYPKVAELMADRHNVYNDTVKYVRQKEKQGEVFVICPEEALPIGRTEKDPAKLKQVYEIGRRAGEKYLQEVIEFFK